MLLSYVGINSHLHFDFIRDCTKAHTKENSNIASEVEASCSCNFNRKFLIYKYVSVNIFARGNSFHKKSLFLFFLPENKSLEINCKFS